MLIDERAHWWDLTGWARLRRQLITGRFDRVYDLQTSSRSSRYFHLFPRHARPEWSGIALGCSHPDRDPGRNRLHDIDRQFAQLRAAGVTEAAPADLSWTAADLGRFALPDRFALLVPGSSAHRLIKRWPVRRYAELAGALLTRSITPAVRHSRHRRRKARPGQSAKADAAGDRSDQPAPSLARAGHPWPARRKLLAVGNDAQADASDRRGRLSVGGAVLARLTTPP